MKVYIPMWDNCEPPIDHSYSIEDFGFTDRGECVEWIKDRGYMIESMDSCYYSRDPDAGCYSIIEAEVIE